MNNKGEAMEPTNEAKVRLFIERAWRSFEHSLRVGVKTARERAEMERVLLPLWEEALEDAEMAVDAADGGAALWEELRTTIDRIALLNRALDVAHHSLSKDMSSRSPLAPLLTTSLADHNRHVLRRTIRRLHNLQKVKR